MKLSLCDGWVFVEAVPGILSAVATKVSWDALSPEGQHRVVAEVYTRLGVSAQSKHLET